MAVNLGPSARKGTCEHCGAHVSTDFARVYGDGDNRIHRCPNCDSWIRLQKGSGAGLDVSISDPETAPGHRGGTPTEWSL